MIVKYFDYSTLMLAAQIAEKRGYNRQVDMNDLDVDPAKVYPVVFSMVHEHAAGVPVDPHIRAMIVLNENPDRVLLDVDWGLFDGLPEADLLDD